jgi:hypothetical protein
MNTHSNDTRIPIVIVYLQNSLPNYAKKNIEYLSKMFPNNLIYVISDLEIGGSLKSLANVELRRLKNMQLEISKIEGLSSSPAEFRNGFWISTIARFKALETLMKSESLERILHIEADVLLLPHFPLDSILFRGNYIAYPFVSDTDAAASVFYVGSLQALEELNDFVFTTLEHLPSASDMRILFEFSRMHPEKFHCLFSGKEDHDVPEAKWIFDAATFGMYLTGDDPRNAKGYSKIYANVSGHFISPSEYQFSFTKENRLVATRKEKTYEIMNLHIHSKKSRYFRYRTFSSAISRAVNKDDKSVTSEFSLTVWTKLVVGYLKRRLPKLNKTFRKRNSF